MSEEKKEYEILRLKNCRVKYAKVIRPGKAYTEGRPDEWSVNIYPTAEDREALMAHGCNPKEDKAGEEYWVAKRSTKAKSGKDVAAPKVVDAKLVPFPEDIGNGSVCNINVTLFPWKMGPRSGIKLYLNAVQVVNHVAYSAGGDDFDPVDVPEDQHREADKF